MKRSCREIVLSLVRENRRLARRAARLEMENAALREAAPAAPLKAVWGGDKPFAAFLADGTKISIDGNKRGCWLKIAPAARIVAHELNGGAPTSAGNPDSPSNE